MDTDPPVVKAGPPKTETSEPSRLQSPEFGQAAEEREAADIGDVIGVPDKEDLAGDAMPLMLSHILYIFESNVRS